MPGPIAAPAAPAPAAIPLIAGNLPGLPSPANGVPATPDFLSGLFQAMPSAISAFEIARKEKARREQLALQKQNQESEIAYRKWMQQHGATEDQIQAARAGLVKLPDGSYGPDPRIAKILGGDTTSGATPGMTTFPITPNTSGAIPSNIPPANPSDLPGGAAQFNSPVMQALTNAKRFEDNAAHAIEQANKIAQLNPSDPHILVLQNSAREYMAQAAAIRAQTKDDVTMGQQQRLQAFQANLRYPKNWSTMKPKDQIAYLQQRLLREQQLPGGEKLASATNAEIARIESSIREDRQQHHDNVMEDLARRAGDRADRRINISLDGLHLRQENAGAGSDVYQNVIKQIQGKTHDEALKIVENAPLSRSDFDRAMRVVNASPKTIDTPISTALKRFAQSGELKGKSIDEITATLIKQRVLPQGSQHGTLPDGTSGWGTPDGRFYDDNGKQVY